MNKTDLCLLLSSSLSLSLLLSFLLLSRRRPLPLFHSSSTTSSSSSPNLIAHPFSLSSSLHRIPPSPSLSLTLSLSLSTTHICTFTDSIGCNGRHCSFLCPPAEEYQPAAALCPLCPPPCPPLGHLLFTLTFILLCLLHILRPGFPPSLPCHEPPRYNGCSHPTTLTNRLPTKDLCLLDLDLVRAVHTARQHHYCHGFARPSLLLPVRILLSIPTTPSNQHQHQQ